MSLSDDQMADISQSLRNADQRLKAIETELAVARRNEAAFLEWVGRTDEHIRQIDECLIENDMATRNPLPVEDATAHTCTVHHLTPKEPA